MAFANLPILFLGSVLVAVPIALHLMMRQKPKQLVFPSLRFLQQRNLPNKRRLQLRHWMLLLMRCAAILLLAFALAGPSVASALMSNWLVLLLLGIVLLTTVCLTVVAWVQKRGIWLRSILTFISMALLALLLGTLFSTLSKGSNFLVGKQEEPVAAALVFDTSPRMSLRFQNQSRMERAKEIAAWLLSQLPKDSNVAIADTRTGATGMAVDTGAAARAVESLEPTSLPRSLGQVIRDAMRLISKSEKRRRELYVFTDLTEPSWKSDLELTNELLEGMSIQVIDVGVEDASNLSLDELRLSSETLASGSPLRLSTNVTSFGPTNDKQNVSIELRLEDQDPNLPIILDGQVRFPDSQIRGLERFDIAAGDRQRAEFELLGLEPGLHHGSVTLVNNDSLPIDNARYFSIRVGQPWQILLAVPGEPLESKAVTADHIQNVLSPAELQATDRSKFDCNVISTSQLKQTTLSDYDAIAVLDPTPLDDGTWEALQSFAAEGGGVAFFLGAQADPLDAFNSDAAQSVLPGKLTSQWRAPDGVYLAPRNLSHPIFKPFQSIATSVPWDAMPVFRHWWIDEVDADAIPIIRFGNNQPAIFEQTIGAGRILTMMTPVSETSTNRRRLWNRLPTSLDDGWPFVILIDRIFLYLVQEQETRLNYAVGEEASLKIESNRTPKRFQLFTPKGDWQEVSAAGRDVHVSFTEQPGTYRLKSDDQQLGFSTNLSTDVSNLTRIGAGKLDKLFGAEQYRIAKSEDEIQRDIGEARVGREFYPILVIIFIVVLGMENLLSNRFYKN